MCGQVHHAIPGGLQAGDEAWLENRIAGTNRCDFGRVTISTRKKDHALTGNWVGHRECHILPDWLLVYRA